MSLLPLEVELFKNGLIWQLEDGTLAQLELIATLNVGDRMMKGSAIQNAQLFGSACQQVTVTRARSLLIVPSNAGVQMKWDSVMFQRRLMIPEFRFLFLISLTCAYRAFLFVIPKSLFIENPS